MNMQFIWGFILDVLRELFSLLEFEAKQHDFSLRTTQNEALHR